MKIKIPATKPRNPVALPARQRKAGSHGPVNRRRIAKQELRLLLQGRRKDYDA